MLVCLICPSAAIGLHVCLSVCIFSLIMYLLVFYFSPFSTLIALLHLSDCLSASASASVCLSVCLAFSLVSLLSSCHFYGYFPFLFNLCLSVCPPARPFLCRVALMSIYVIYLLACQSVKQTSFCVHLRRRSLVIVVVVVVDFAL